jgi:hypothetical protein
VTKSAHLCAPIGTNAHTLRVPAGPDLGGAGELLQGGAPREAPAVRHLRRTRPGAAGALAPGQRGLAVALRPSPGSRVPRQTSRAGSGREPAGRVQRGRLPDQGPLPGHRRAPEPRAGAARGASPSRLLLLAGASGRGRAALRSRGGAAAGHRRAPGPARPGAGAGALGADHAPLVPGRALARRASIGTARTEAAAGAAQPIRGTASGRRAAGALRTREAPAGCPGRSAGSRRGRTSA